MPSCKLKNDCMYSNQDSVVTIVSRQRIQRQWSSCVADLRLCCLHMHNAGFFHDMAHYFDDEHFNHKKHLILFVIYVEILKVNLKTYVYVGELVNAVYIFATWCVSH